MLLEFNVTNFRSIAEPQTLSLIASSDKKLRASHVVDSHLPATLKSAVMYGPNAAGKSTILQAIKFVDEFVAQSVARKFNEKIEITPHAFGPYEDKPSEFEVVFISEGTRYQYGFRVTHERVEEEWLYAFPKGRAQNWITRKGSNKSTWRVNPALKGAKKTWIESTRPNALLLSTALQLNAEPFLPIDRWFSNLTVLTGGRITPSYSAQQCENNDWKKKVLRFMAEADLSISDLQITKKKFDLNTLPPEWPNALRHYFSKEMQDTEIREVQVIHQTASGLKANFEIKDESKGTQKIFEYAAPWLDTLKNGLVLFIDEMDTSLHPLLVKFLVNLFHNPLLNKKGAQLIFTTHDTSLLDTDLFRRDQIWFVEKNPERQTELYSLKDFSPRKEENLERGYLHGRYGALPFIRNNEFI